MSRIFNYVSLSVAFSCIVAGMSFAGEEKAGANVAAEAKKREEAAARRNWINHQIELVEKVGGSGYDKVSNWLLERAKTGVDSPDGKPLNEQEQISLKRAVVKINLAQINVTPQYSKKLKIADEAMTLMKTIVNAMPEKSASRMDAQKDMVASYFQIARTFADIYEKSDKTGASAERKAIQEHIDELTDDIKPEKEKYDELKKNYDKLAKAKRTAANTKKMKDIRADMTKIANGYKGKEKEIEGLKLSLDGMVSPAVLRDRAREYFDAGIKAGEPVRKVYDEQFNEFLVAYNEVDEKEDAKKAAALATLQAAYGRKVLLQHEMEDAYASQLNLYDYGSATHQDMAKKAQEFMDAVYWDYNSYTPYDKTVFIHWIRVLSHLREDISKPKHEDEEGFDKDELSEMRNSYEHWLWPYLRMDYFWQKHFAETWKPPLAKENRANPESIKIKGLYYYTLALMRKHKAVEERARIATGEDKAKWTGYAGQIGEQLEKALKYFTSGPPQGFPKFDDLTERSSKINILAEYYMDKAEAAIKRNDKEQAIKDVQEAKSVTSSVMDSDIWRSVAEKKLRVIMSRAKTMGLDIPPTADDILASANKKYRETYTANDARKQLLYAEAMDLYMQVVEMTKHYKDKDKRVLYLPLSLFRIGTCGWFTGDFQESTMAYFWLVREFGGPKYPVKDYPAMARYVELAIKNLHSNVGKFLSEDEKSTARWRLYVDSLTLLLDRNPNPPEAMRFELINRLIGKLKMYDEAMVLINKCPESDPYYRMSILLGASVFRNQAAPLQAEKRDLKTKATDEGRELTDAEKQRIVEIEKESAIYNKKAEEYSVRFLAAWGKRPSLPKNAPEWQVKLYDDEDRQTPNVILIPLANKFSEGKYDEVLKEVPGAVAKIKGVTLNKNDKDKDTQLKAMALATIYQMKLNSIILQVDRKKDEIAKVHEAYKQANSVVPELIEYDKASGEEKYSSNIPMMMGQNFLLLAKRYFDTLDEEKQKTEESDGNSYYNQLRKDAVKYFEMAEKIAYENLSTAISMIDTYNSTEMYDKAEELCRKIVNYWSKSLFSTGYLYRTGKSLADIKGYSVPEEIKKNMESIVHLASVKGAANDKALVSVLNAAIEKFDSKANQKAVKAILNYTIDEYKDMNAKSPRLLVKNLRSALELADREDLEDNAQARQRLARFTIEAIFPKALARAKNVPLIPTPKYFDEMIGKFLGYYPSTNEGKMKSAVLRYMHSQGSVRLDDDRKLVKKYIKELEDGMAKAGGKARMQLAKWKQLTDSDLKTLVYGYKDNRHGGQIRGRSYYKAYGQIVFLVEFDEKGLTLGADEPKNGMPTHSKVDNYRNSFLDKLKESMIFNIQIIQVERKYVVALIHNKKYDEAIKHLKRLIDLFPTDRDLVIDLADAYTEIGISKGEKEYNQDVADQFIFAQVRAGDALRVAPRHSTLWWQSYLSTFKAIYNEVLIRKKHGANEVDYETTIPDFYFRGKYIKHTIKTVKSLEEEAQGNLLIPMTRMLKQSPPAEVAEKFEEMLTVLKEQGYKLPEVKTIEQPPAPKSAEERAAEEKAKESGKDEKKESEAKEGEKSESGKEEKKGE